MTSDQYEKRLLRFSQGCLSLVTSVGIFVGACFMALIAAEPEGWIAMWGVICGLGAAFGFALIGRGLKLGEDG